VKKPKYTDFKLYIFSVSGQCEATDVYLIAGSLQRKGIPVAPRLLVNYKKKVSYPFIISLVDSLPKVIVRERKIDFELLQEVRFSDMPDSVETIRWLYRFALEQKFEELKNEIGYTEITPGKYYFSKIFPSEKTHRIGVFEFKPYDEISILPLTNGRVLIIHNKRTRIEATETLGELVKDPTVRENLKRQAKVDVSKVKFVHRLSNRGFEPLSIEFRSPAEALIPDLGKTVFDAISEFWSKDPRWRAVKESVKDDIGYFKATRIGVGSLWYRIHKYGIRYIPGITIYELGDMIKDILKTESKEVEFDHVWLLRDGPVLEPEREDFREAMLEEGFNYVLASIIGMGGGRMLHLVSANFS